MTEITPLLRRFIGEDRGINRPFAGDDIGRTVYFLWGKICATIKSKTDSGAVQTAAKVAAAFYCGVACPGFAGGMPRNGLQL